MPLVEPIAPARRAVPDPVAILLAVERVGADVNALSRALATQPEEVAARLDVDAGTASIVLRVSALGSALDQFRLSLLAAIDRTADRLDAPAWLPDLQAAVDPTHHLARLEQTIARLANDPRLDAPAADIAVSDPADRLARLEPTVGQLADGVSARVAIADALDQLGGRLASIEDAAVRVAQDAHVLLERVDPVPERLSAIAMQVERIMPPARAGDQAGSLLDHLDRVGARVDEAVSLLRARASRSAEQARDDHTRMGAVIDALGGVSKRQEEVTAAVASAVDQVRGPKGVESVLDRMDHRERLLVARLDHIDNELRRQAARAAEPVPTGPVSWDPADRSAVQSLVTSVEAMAAVTENLGRLVEATAARLEERLSRVEAAIDQAAAQPAPSEPAGPSAAATLAALRLAELRSERAQVRARLEEERLLASEEWDDAP